MQVSCTRKLHFEDGSPRDQLHNEIWECCQCDPNDLQGSCWKRVCDDCHGRFESELSELDKCVDEWYEWNKNDTGHIRNEKLNGCLGELVENITEGFPDYQEHVRVKRVQANNFESDNNNTHVMYMYIHVHRNSQRCLVHIFRLQSYFLVWFAFYNLWVPHPLPHTHHKKHGWFFAIFVRILFKIAMT